MQASLPAIPATRVLKSTQRGALTRDLLEVAEKDYLHVLRGIATEQIEQQRGLGYKATGMMVDGKRSTPLDEATRSIVVWFADRDSLAKAIIDARNELRHAGRSVTGRTLNYLTFYYSTGKGGALTSCEPRMTAATVKNPASLDLYVTLPLAHVRRWQWYGKSGRRLTRRSRAKRYRYLKGKQRPLVSKSVFETAAKRVQARYRALDVKFVFLSVPNLNVRGQTPVDSIPAIKVRMAVRGRGH